MPNPTVVLNSQAIERAITRIAHEIAERNEDSAALVLVAIQTGGYHLARRLAALLQQILKLPIPVADIDVSMHRDDLDQRLPANVHPTSIPFDVNGKIVVLVDDVLFRGRTVRAALDALNDFGRPKAIQLAVLVDRGHRELPIKADFVGKNIPTSKNQLINVSLGESGDEDVVYLENI